MSSILHACDIPLGPCTPPLPRAETPTHRRLLTGHGDLLNVAAAHLASAHADLTSSDPTTREDARAEILVYRELLHALRVHAQLLFGPHRIGTVRQAVAPDPADAAGLHLIDTLTAAVHRRPCPLAGHTAPRSGVSVDLLLAARAIRAASDLLTTHRDVATGAWRAPDSHHLDDRAVRIAGLQDVARLVAIASGDEPQLTAAPASWPAHDPAVAATVQNLMRQRCPQ